MPVAILLVQNFFSIKDELFKDESKRVININKSINKHEHHKYSCIPIKAFVLNIDKTHIGECQLAFLPY